MKPTHTTSTSALEEQFGRRVSARLSAGTGELPHDLAERLRVGRERAMAHRKEAPRPAMPTVVAGGIAARLGGLWWMRVGSVVPLVALVAGLIVISVMQDDNRADQLAEIDSALLTDDLPPAAFTDPGFAQFLKTSAMSER
ncbi:MAG: DUF3619 family protein [Gammaproteobacteria bacterium]|nr:DUF3619 family protein [Gammaproteobacteria bacterium]MBU1530569.1 DUF3619 family protein [Gammaproteobacteria bacterium]MBU2285304.1 DUF3619 family protein [Gammaproteobacteria bacterium]MBU2409317.1 DUF3619 family protein [Gammaproteobacteria bacterium]